MILTRRRFGTLAGSALASMAFGSGCDVQSFPGQATDGRLRSRPVSGAVKAPPQAGTRALGIGLGGSSRDALLHVPLRATTAPLPLLVLLHGAGGSGANQLRRFGSVPDELGVAVLAPDSRGSSWDAIQGGFGRDVAFINDALERTFQIINVDPRRLAIGGFSDGATYALSVGLINGDLFPKIVAFSPGFVVQGPPNGKPRVFVSHGTHDDILPIARCSRIIVPALKQRGYEVTFREFDGGHTVPPEIAVEGFKWVSA